MTQPPPLPSYPAHLSAQTLTELAHRERVPHTNGLAITSLVLGILGFVPLANLAAIVLGIVALAQLKHRDQPGRGVAIGGLCAAGAWILFLVAVIVLTSIDR